MPGVPSSMSHIRRFLVAASLSLAACHHAPGPGRVTRATRVVPVAGYCGQRSAIVVYRGATPRRPATRSGALVVRLSPADSGLMPPQGPVRVRRVSDASDAPTARLLSLTRQVGLTGPLPAGRYVVEAAGTGYQPRRFTVAVRPGATDTVHFRLAAACVRRASR
jgi:hypothetical protein